jgi:hypothetical protein
LDEMIARRLLDGIALGAIVVWFIGLIALLWAWQRDYFPPEEKDEVFDPDLDSGPPGPRLSGSAVVPGDPESLSFRAADILARWLVPGALVIEQRYSNRVVFTSTGLAGAWGLGGCRRGVLDFRALSLDRTRVDYTLTVNPRRWLLAVGSVIQVLGLVVLVGGYWALSNYIAPSLNPGLRYQVVQMLQVVHLLWPPILMAFLYRKVRESTAAQIRGLVQNLPYLDPAGSVPVRFRGIQAPRRHADPDP